MAKKLHEVIVDVIRTAGKPLKTAEIAKLIQEQKLWAMPSSGDAPKRGQIAARINNYQQIFKSDNGYIGLRKTGSEKRLLRVTYNENLWELPSGHLWSKVNQSKTDVAYENMFGFGGEEWLFNNRYHIDGYQYGYIRGLREVLDTDKIDVGYLFCIHPETKDRLLVAIINDLELLDPTLLPVKVQKTFAKYTGDMINELKNVGTDYKNADISDFYPIVRFKLKEANLFDQPIIVNELKEGRRYNRFKPYKMDGDLEDFLKKAASIRPKKFIPGKRKITQGGHARTVETRSQKVAAVHNEITDQLERFLAPEYRLEAKNIAIENMFFGNNIADFVLQRPDKKLIIMEIKTSSNARYNVREALGQLLDYASWEDTFIIEELIIVSPVELRGELKEYFVRIKNALGYNLSYWHYCRENDRSKKFIKY